MAFVHPPHLVAVDEKSHDVDAVYFALSRCGLDEDSFDALFQFVVLASEGTDAVRAFALYCRSVRLENKLRKHMKRNQLALVTLTTMFDVLEEYSDAACLAQKVDHHSLAAIDASVSAASREKARQHSRYDMEDGAAG
ncbi:MULTISPECIES: hypothetical protein [unclassified Rhizobium]|uniref:hypothetical protein n=1 Tax=unclassified Rhizobium TaxID=2613769 RepID=UPI001781477D|nr:MULTISPECIES: hypothetical protein [unclassified Rhizobium]MBD8687194.1 hypothetical protein [Rhizobium sp. CFBP 13644]MBD8691003.1 hypothetical protein [Rhizobium sp. CFBP 13717]